VLGNGQVIVDGDTSPSAGDGTDFGSSPLSQAITHTFTISNSGLAALQLSGPPLVALSGPNASDFSVVTVPSTPVGAGQATTFQVRFRPSATGVRLATVSITSNDPDESPYTFTIQGTGSPPVANNHVYLPLVLKDFANAPGVTVESINASSRRGGHDRMGRVARSSADR
jgi:hypothetical protein